MTSSPTRPNPTLWDLLARVRNQPGMYMREGRELDDLELFLCGYAAALHTHGISDEAVTFREAFSTYVSKTRGWSCSCGWADAITNHTETAGEAVATFFSILEEFRIQAADRIG